MSNAPQATRAVVTPLRVAIALCLAAPFVALLRVGSYARKDPALAGVPFFYWYQMLWVLVSAVLTMTAYRLWQRDRRTAGASPVSGTSRAAGTSSAATAEDGGAAK
ncbi:DUF3311 domain-containing protein [Streptomyces sp. NPDC006700]|uniref:DUF3311 domain-containing protein n=1 Tax=Streptomyces sp. NPDC006700 TaxID=3154479 RepID=UPI0033FB83CC